MTPLPNKFCNPRRGRFFYKDLILECVGLINDMNDDIRLDLIDDNIEIANMVIGYLVTEDYNRRTILKVLQCLGRKYGWAEEDLENMEISLDNQISEWHNAN